MALAASPHPAEAVTYTFKNTVSQKWSDSGNWSSPAPASNGSFDQDILIGDSSNTSVTALISPFDFIDPNRNLRIHSLHFATTGNGSVGDSFSILYGYAFYVASGGTIGDVTGTHLISLGVQLNSDGLGGTNSTLITTGFDVAGLLTITGAVSGNSGLSVTGGGTLSLNSITNSYSGATTIAAGTKLSLGDHGALPSTTSLTVNGTFQVQPYGDHTVGALRGSGTVAVGYGDFMFGDATDTSYLGTFTSIAVSRGAVVKVGAGTTTITASYAGGTTIEGGKLLILGGGSAFYSLVGGTGTVEFRSAFSGVMPGIQFSGDGTVVKSGTGTLTMLTTQVPLMALTINGGTIATSANGALNGTTITNNTVLDLKNSTQSPKQIIGTGAIKMNGGSLTLTGGGTLSGIISGSGSFATSGTAELAVASQSTYVGPTTIGGPVSLGVSNALPTTTDLTVKANSTLKLKSFGQTVASIGGAGEIDLGTGSLTVSSGSFSGSLTGAGGLMKTGTGTLTLSGSGSYLGGTTVSGGTLIVARPTGSYLDNAALEFSNDADVSSSASVSGTGSLTKTGAGTMTLTGPMTLTGGTIVSAGRLVVANPGGAYVDNATLEISNSTDQSIGEVSGTGSFVKSGSGTLTGHLGNTGGVRVSGGSLDIDGEGAFSGGLTIDAGASFLNSSGGTVIVGGRSYVQGEIDSADGSTTVFSGLVSGNGSFGGFGAVEFDGGYSPGNSPASVTLQGDMTLGGSNDLTMELAGTTLGTGYDHLNVLGTVALGGSLNVTYYGGFSASLGQTFDLFDFAHSTGTFASLSLPTLAQGLVWNTSSLYSNGVISVQAQAVPEPTSLVALGLGGLVVLRRRRK